MKKRFRILLAALCLLVAIPPAAHAQTYCAPTASCGNGNFIGIFRLRDLSNNTGSNCAGGGSNGPVDFTSQTVTLMKGTTENATVAVGFGGPFGVSVWIDFDNDGTFSASEQFAISGQATAGSFVNIPIAIPAGASTGNRRIRVRAIKGTNGTAIDPCTNYTDGETEDYTASIIAAAAPTVTGVSPTYGCQTTATGTNFYGVTGVKLGGQPAARYVVLNSTTLSVVPAAGATGQIEITTANGSATSAASFTGPVAPPSAVTASPSTVYVGEPITLSATSAGNNIGWFSTLTGGIAFATTASGANTIRTETVSGNYTYYTEAQPTATSNTIYPTNTTSDGNGVGMWTLGYTFIPNKDLVVTHVRSYYGTKVSVWDAAGTLIFSQPVSGPANSWTTTQLSSPVILQAGVNYRLGAYIPSGTHYRKTGLNASFADGFIGNSVENQGGDGVPTKINAPTFYMVDLVYSPTICNSRPRVAAPVTVKAPEITGNTPASRCGTGTLSLAATAAPAAAQVRWYNVNTGGTSLFTGSAFTTPSISATTTYYAEPVLTATTTVGSGSQTTTSLDGISPFEHYFGNYRHQYLILASELARQGLSAGPLTALSFDVTGTYGGAVAALNNFAVAIKGTTITSLTAFETGLTTVATSNYTPTTGINTFSFTAPFNWNGTDNIVVQTCFNNNNNNNGAATSGSAVKYDATDFVSHLYSGTYNSGSGICSNATLTDKQSKRPKIIFSSLRAGTRVAVVATVAKQATINTQPQPTTICAGQTLNLSVAATDATGYQWKRNGTDIPGAISQNYSFPNATTAQAGNYSVTLTSAAPCSTLTSSAAAVVVDNPAISLSPASQTMNCSGIVPINITITDASNPTLTWNTTQGLFTNAGATTPYGGGSATTVYAKRNTPALYQVTVKSGSCTGAGIPATAEVYINSNSGNLPTTPSSYNQTYSQLGTVDVYDANCKLLVTTAPTGAHAIAGSVETQVYIDNAVQTTANGQPYVQRHYQITPATDASTATGTITLYATNAEFKAYNAFLAASNPLGLPPLPDADISTTTGTDKVRITKLSGTSATGAPGSFNPGTKSVFTPTVSWNQTQSRWEMSINVTGFSGFFIHTGSGPLPVTFTAIDARADGIRNRITWQVGAEDQVAGYEVQKMVEEAFTTIGKKPATGAASYVFYDQRPHKGRNTYRVKSVDVDGSMGYSPTAVVLIADENGFLLELFPNPTPNIITLRSTGSAAAEATVTINELSGRTVLRRNVKASEDRINLSALPAGTYLLQWNDGLRRETLRVTKQ